MKLKFFLTTIFAVIVGVAFAHSAVFVAKNTYQFAVKGFENFDKSVFNFSFAQNFFYQKKDLGGQEEADATDVSDEEYERFPGNSPELIRQEKDLIEKGIISSNLEIPREGRAVVANLEAMNVVLYEDGKATSTFDILSRGRPGTAWETPPGAFDVLYKKENHFSTIGKVWMPYSMQFFGNYFIHGWPYYPDGTPVAEGYSGGCIRLANSDMEKIYNFSDVGTKVIILGAKENNISFNATGNYKMTDKAVSFPKLTAKAYLVADLDTGEIIESYSEKKKLPIASLSKMMTALVSLETVNQYNTATVSKTAYGTYGAQGKLAVGDKILTSDLLYPLLLESSNDAAEVLAEFAGRKTFIKNMNDKADSVGLINTSFEDPSGLSPNNISTAEDLFKLARYIYKYKSYIFEITKLKDYKTDDYKWFSNSKFRNDKNYLGGKNGFTDEAQHTLVTILELPLGEFEKRHIAIVLLDAQTTEKDARSVVWYLLNSVYYSE